MNYGIELEFVFAFHQDLLDVPTDQISKSLPYYLRESYPKFSKIDPVKLPNHCYNSWGVLENSPDKEPRPYGDEPLAIVKRALDEYCPKIPTKVKDTIYAWEKTNELYDKWIITPDHTVCGVGSENIPKWLPKRTIPDPSLWDSYGLELVSPVFNTANAEANNKDICHIIEGVLGNFDYDFYPGQNALEPPKNYGAFVTNQCGLHVHVEAPKDILVLQQLAKLTLVFEEEISRLHPVCRRPGHDSARRQLDSNRIYFMTRDDPIFFAGRRDISAIDCSTKALAKVCSIRQIDSRIRLMRTKNSLSENMCGVARGIQTPGKKYAERNRLINWTYINREESQPETIEFRQSRSSECWRKKIPFWVEFCTKLIKFAEFCAKDPENNFPVKKWEDLHQAGEPDREKYDVWSLMTDMGLSEEAIKFFNDKIYSYGPEYEKFKPGGSDDRTDNEEAPVEEEYESDEEDRMQIDNNDGNDSKNTNYGKPIQPINTKLSGIKDSSNDQPATGLALDPIEVPTASTKATETRRL